MSIQRALTILFPMLVSPAVGAAPTTMELVLPEALLTETLASLAPFEHRVDPGGLNQALRGTGPLTVTLSRPRVRVSNAAIRVGLHYRLRDATGTLDLEGEARPDLEIVAIPGRGVLQARFKALRIALPGLGEVDLARFVDPIEWQGTWTTDVRLGGRRMSASARATRVVTERGRVRVQGTVTLRPIPAASKTRERR